MRRKTPQLITLLWERTAGTQIPVPGTRASAAALPPRAAQGPSSASPWWASPHGGDPPRRSRSSGRPGEDAPGALAAQHFAVPHSLLEAIVKVPLTSAPLRARFETDWTALLNFAALRGQLRVSFGPACNIACWFCHDEGDIPPGLARRDRSKKQRPRSLCAAHYVTVITALMDAGLKRVYFTGGEPLTSPWLGRCWNSSRSPARTPPTP